MSSDTIFAKATGAGPAGVAIMRVSGPKALSVAEQICGSTLEPRVPVLRSLRAKDRTIIDEALVLYFPDGQSFTGEKIVEYQCHGSLAVMERLAAELASYGHRSADRGEFTYRALMNNRMDLAQVEGLSDLVDAATEEQRKQALGVMQGALSTKTEDLRANVLRAQALVTATIDFADEEVPVDVSPEVSELIQSVRIQLQSELEGLWFNERVRDGFEVAIIGAPNAGKSTLLNRLAGRDAAITSDIAGTTRDIVEVQMNLDGLPVTILDTAGLRTSDDQIEQIGIERAVERAKVADLRIFLGEGGLDFLTPEEGDIQTAAKIDQQRPKDGFGVSGKTGEGVDDLLKAVVTELSARSVPDTSAINQRQGDAIASAIEALNRAEGALPALLETPELISLPLSDAAHALSSLIGDVDIEHILSEIFSRFCIGK